MANVRELGSSQDRILIVESDPAVSDLIGRQALQSFGFLVQVAPDATTAIARALQWSPDLILVDLHLPGLSGKDLIIALRAQGINTPLIILAQRGMEADLIQTFRLGAADYIFLPAREAEVVNAVSRVIQQVRDRRERDRLAQQLQQTNQELESRVRELTTIFALGKAMTSITDHSVLFGKILEGSVRITRADLGWFMLREDSQRPFVVAAAYKMPPALGVRLNQPWDDGISSLVALSGELLEIHGDPLKRFKIAALGKAALIVPVSARKKVMGLLVMLRQQENPFGVSEQHLLSALADYASISLVNARLFRDVEGRARTLQYLVDTAQMSDKVKNEILRLVKKEISSPLRRAQAALDGLSRDPLARWRPIQREQLTEAQAAVLHSREIIDAVSPDALPKSVVERAELDLAEAAKASQRRLQPYAQRCGVQLTSELQPGTVVVTADSRLVAQVLDSALSNAIKFAEVGGQVLVRVEKDAEQLAHVTVRNSGSPLDPAKIEQILSQKAPAPKTPAQEDRFGGLGIGLRLAKEIILKYNGKLWIESQAGKGNELHITLPAAHGQPQFS